MSDQIERFATNYAARLRCQDQSDDLAREAFVRIDRFLEVRSPEIWLLLVADVERGVAVFNNRLRSGSRKVDWRLLSVEDRFTVTKPLLPEFKLTVTFDRATHAIRYDLAGRQSESDSLETLKSGRFQLEKSPSGYEVCLAHKGRTVIREDAAEFLLSLVFDSIK